MPKIITIANSKGGVGKSTITLNLYQYFTANGAKCSILDADLQQSITQLNEVYEKGLELIPPEQELSNLQRLDYELILIDTPPYRTGAAFVEIADFVLIPLNPSPLDAMAVRSILEDVGKTGTHAGIVLNRVQHGTSLTDGIRETVEGFGGKVLQTVLHNRVAYQRAAIRTDLDSEGNHKANQEISNLANEVLRLML